jgi:hypothetical protein
MAKVFFGMNIQTPLGKHQMILGLVKEVALTLYNNEITRLGTIRRQAAADAQEDNDACNNILVQDVENHLTNEDVSAAIQTMFEGIYPRQLSLLNNNNLY